MNKKSISSLELAAIVNELQFLIKGKVAQIYYQEKELLLQLHAPGAGKQFLRIVPGKFMCLTAKKEVPLRPSGFCMQLRKHLDNAFIKSIYLKDFERIVVMELEKTDKFFLIIELFSQGNIVLTDDKYIIIGVLTPRTWKERIVQPNEKYVFPTPSLNWKTVTESQLYEIIKNSDKKNIAISLAVETGLGGLYAEEICQVNEIDFKKEPREIKEKEAKQIVRTMTQFLEQIKKSQGYIYEEQITPFPLTGQEAKKTTKTYNEAINTLQLTEVISPYEQRIRALQKMVTEQEEAIINLQRKIELNTKKGELIYERYVPLQKLLVIVKEMRKSKKWGEIAQELRKEKKINKIDLEHKTVTIEL